MSLAKLSTPVFRTTDAIVSSGYLENYNPEDMKLCGRYLNELKFVRCMDISRVND